MAYDYGVSSWRLVISYCHGVFTVSGKVRYVILSLAATVLANAVM